MASLADGLWATSSALVAYNTPTSSNLRAACPLNGCPATASSYLVPALIAVGVVLAVDSFLMLGRFRLTFVIGVALSAAVLSLAALSWDAIGGTNSLVAIALSVVVVAVDALASTASKGISEQSHPMNLPVFG